MTPAVHPQPIAAPSDGVRDEFRALLRLAGPLVAANLLQMAVYAMDVVFVARLGSLALAASTLGVFLYSMFVWSLIGLTGACAPIIAAEIGRKRHAVREVRRSFRMAMWLAVIACIPFVAILAHGETVLLLAGQDPQVAQATGRFLDILLFALVPGVLAGVMRTAAAALGRPGWAMLVTGLALVVGVTFNWLLVFGNLGFPALGLEGSALASLITTIAMVIAFAAILAFDRRLRRYRLFGRWWRPEWSRLVGILKLGIPIALIFTFEGALFGGAAFLMGLIGVSQVAAHGVALNIAAVAFQVPFGVAQAATIRVGMAYGARDPAWIGRAGNVALVVGIGFMGITALAIWIAPRAFVGLYLDTHDPANAVVVALALKFLVIATAFQLLYGAQSVAAGVLRGLQDTRVPMIVALVGYWGVGFGTAVLFAFRLGWGGVGVWLGLAAGLFAVSALLLWRWRARNRLGLVPGVAQVGG